MKRKLTKILLALLVLAVLGFVGLSALLLNAGHQLYSNHQNEAAIEKLQNDIMLPVVRVKIEFKAGGRVYKGFGSGVVVYSEKNELQTGYDTYVLTCNHVVEYPMVEEVNDPRWGPTLRSIGWKYGCKYVEFFDETGKSIRKVPARVIDRSANNVFTVDDDGNFMVAKDEIDPQTGQKHGEDTALLKLEVPEQFPVAKIATRETLKALKVFDKVRLVGCALGDKPIPTFGEITRVEEDFMSINAPAIFGNSGGPCYLDGSHELIGLLNCGRATNGGFVTHMVYMRPMIRVYDWLDILGYEFLYEKSVASEIKFATIRQDMDMLRFRAIEEKSLMESRISALEKINIELLQSLAVATERGALVEELVNKVMELEKEIDILKEKLLKKEYSRQESFDAPEELIVPEDY